MHSKVGVAVKGRYLRRTGLVELSEPAYKKDVVHPIERYDEKKTPLSRGYAPPGGWDDKFVETLVLHAGEQGELPRQEPGYTQVDVALRMAGFHIAMASNCHTGNWTRPALSEELGCFYDWKGYWGPENMALPWKPNKMAVNDPDEMSSAVIDAALFLGASLVGITRLNRNWLYSTGWDRYGHRAIDLDVGIPDSIQYVVVLAIETNYDYIRHAPTARASAATGLGYSKMAFLAPSLAKFISSLGYNAIACGNDTALSIPLAVDAGLGQLGRLGTLITPEFGPRVRLCKVLTDLPLVPTAPVDFGVTEFCNTCQKCAEYCPSQAIFYGKRTPKARTYSTNPGLAKWPLNGEKCMRYWFKNGARTENGIYHLDCYQCINVCPFNKLPGMGHDMVRWMIRKKRPMFNRLLKYGDDLFYKVVYPTSKFSPKR